MFQNHMKYTWSSCVLVWNSCDWSHVILEHVLWNFCKCVSEKQGNLRSFKSKKMCPNTVSTVNIFILLVPPTIIWFQKHRSSLQDILDLIQAIIYDYCILVPTSLPALESMVKHSSLLASQFLTAVTLLHPMYKPQTQGTARAVCFFGKREFVQEFVREFSQG